jgi:hypothetical protein
MKTTFAAFAALLLMASLPVPAMAASSKVPATPGSCAETSIKDIGTRLEGVADSGSALDYANGIDGVSYDTVPEVTAAKAGDKVELCLVSLPQNCPKGDDRGKVWLAVDLKTHQFWQLPDAEHMCGGA